MTPRSIGLTGVAFALVLDRATKAAILATASDNPAWIVNVTPFFDLVLLRNDGVSFGLLSGNVAWWGLSLAALVIVAFLLRWLWREASSLNTVGLGLIIGGALGNVMDRFWHGAVTDFLDFHMSGWHWPAFNLADTAIFCGVTILIIGPLAGHAGTPSASLLPSARRSQD